MPVTAAQKESGRSRESGGHEAYGGISSDAVKKATGKTWKQWCAAIDKAGGPSMTHKQIAEMLSTRLKVKPWWSQMVTVGYEQARGRRRKHQKTDGFSVSASRTLNVSPAGAFLWWKMDRCRRQWLGDVDIAVHHATPSKSVRATWNASTKTPVKSISVNIYVRGKDRAAMTIQHDKLASTAVAKKMKTYWARQLARLEQLIAEEAGK